MPIEINASAEVDAARLAIEATMGQVGELVAADRVSAFDYDLQAQSAQLTFRWARPGFEGQPVLAPRPLAALPDWDLAAHLRGEAIWIGDCQALPPGALRDAYSGDGMRSILAVPVMEAGRCLGFVQFAWIRTPHSDSGLEQRLLGFVARLMLSTLRSQRAEQARQESESRLRLLSQNLINGMIYQLVVGPDGSRRFTYVSDSVTALYGASPEEVLANPARIYSRVHPDDAVELARAEDAAIQSRRPLRHEVRMLDPDGGVRWSSLASTPTVLGDGSVRWDGIEFVMTEQKRANEALRESEQLFRESQRAAAIGSYRANLTSGQWTSSLVLDQILGISVGYPRTIEGWLALVHPEDRASMSRYLEEEVIGRRVRFERDYRVVRPSDGATRWMLGSGEVSDQRDGLILIGTIQDITARRESEHERERLLMAVEHAAESIVITDTRGIIEYANPAFTRSSGYTREDALGRHTGIPPGGPGDDPRSRELWATIGEGRTWSGRLVSTRKDGAHYTEEVTISPILDSKGVVQNFVAVKHDITDRLRLEAQFLQSQKMEAIGQLAGGVAHDFNNLLSVILSYTSLVMEQLEPIDPLREDLLEVEKAGRRAAEMTSQLLAFGRRQVLNPRVVDLNELVTRLEKMLRRLVGEDIRLATRIAPALWSVRVDPGQIEQVLMNLVVNARDAMAGGGEITIETRNVELDEAFALSCPGATAGPHVLLAVSDSGVGIDEATQRHIFEPFFTTKGVGKGTGLGLSTVLGIVQQSGGVIQVSSAPGQGARFEVYLPRSSAGAKELGPDLPSAPLRHHGETILLAEDEEQVRRMVSGILQRNGYQVLAGANAAEALALSEAYPGRIHLLLSDVVMPGMNGHELAGRLRTARPEVRVLYVSGYAGNVIAQHGIVEEGMDFLPKPITPELLLRRVQQALRA